MEKQIRDNRSNQKNKSLIIVTVVLCVIALLMSGTYAYYNMVSKVNEFGENNDNSAVLHDDYNEDYDKDKDEYEKDVYVENAGATDLFIRVRLEEYLEIDETYKFPGYAEYDEDQGIYKAWHKHNYSTTADGYVCEDCGVGLHSYFEWEMGNQATQIFKRADADEKAASEAYRYVRDSNTEVMEDTWQAAAGSGSIPGVGDNYDIKVWGELPICEVIAMAEYWAEVEKFEQDNQEGINPKTWKGWVLDMDGWAYWSQQLSGGETTGLLLSKVTRMEKLGEESYFYGIRAVLDSIDGLDVGAWMEVGKTTLDGETPEKATANAVKLLKAIGAE